MTSNQKKAKISNGSDGKDFASVREYLMKHELGSKHPAIAAAIRGLDDELKRVERDRKLQAKFDTTTTTTTKSNTARMIPSLLETDDDFSRVERSETHVVLSNNNGTMKTHDADETSIPQSMTDDWHDVSRDNDIGDECMTDASTNEYGTMLAQRAVQAMVDHSVMCRTPLGAVTVALHATLLDRGFVCTGIPPKTPASGFAPPVREITQFLPLDWESSSSDNKDGLKLRYRKTCAIELHTMVEDSATTQQPSLKISLGDVAMTVDCLDDHVNLTSWSKATQNGSKLASPTLHYKSLAKLLGDFAQRFDLGDASTATAPLDDNNQEAKSAAMLRETQVPLFHQVPENVPRQPISVGHFPPHYSHTGTIKHDPLRVGHDLLRMPPTQPQAPLNPFSVGAGDLLPTGLLQYPHQGIMSGGANFPSQGGNLVGPDHPMFMGGSFVDNGLMQPRYDPVGPPGGPTELDPATNPLSRGRVPPGGTGIPNNDLEKQPRFGNDNMFL